MADDRKAGPQLVSNGAGYRENRRSGDRGRPGLAGLVHRIRVELGGRYYSTSRRR